MSISFYIVYGHRIPLSITFKVLRGICFGKENHRLGRWRKSFSYEQKSSYDRMKATDNRNKNHRRCRYGKRFRKLSTHQVEMSTLYCVCPKVPEKNNLWKISSRDWENVKNDMQSLRNRVDRNAGVSGSYPYAGMYTAQNECVQIHGNPQGKKQSDDLQQICPTKIQV